VNAPKSLHAIIVVQRGVDAVNTDSVHAEVLEVLNIASAVVAVRKRVNKAGRLSEGTDGASA
jgi:hypothetical protein